MEWFLPLNEQVFFDVKHTMPTSYKALSKTDIDKNRIFMNTFSSTFGYNNENLTIRDFNMVCDLIEVVLVKKKSERLSLVYEDVLGNLTIKYNELLETDMIKSKRGNWVIRNPFEKVKS